MAEIEVGKVTHYFGHLGVAGILLTDALAVGDTIRIKGHTTDLTLKLESMQVNHVDLHAAEAGTGIGIRVPAHVREHDVVFKVTP